MERVSNLTFLQLPVFHLLHFEFNGTDVNADVSSSSFRFQVSDYFSDGGNRSGLMSRSGLSPFYTSGEESDKHWRPGYIRKMSFSMGEKLWRFS